jgi:2-dehydropantoate 2-reductase
MRICVFGAGAIGGYLAVGLALAKHEVSVIARGAHLDAIQKNGLRLISGDHETRVTVIAKDDPADLDVQDIVICALKAHQAWQLAATPVIDLSRSGRPPVAIDRTRTRYRLRR